ncbi:hypothetical protein DKP78_26065, partial [Enterococcus faecium]
GEQAFAEQARVQFFSVFHHRQSLCRPGFLGVSWAPGVAFVCPLRTRYMSDGKKKTERYLK